MDRKKMLGIVVVPIVLGALGSGLWELLKPLGSGAWNAILAVATLGIESVRDDLYATAARAGSVRAQVAFGYQSLGGIVAALLALVLLVYWRVSPSPFKAARLMVPVLLFLSGTLVFSSARSSYVVGLAGYSDQLQVIAAPYLDPSRRLELASRLAQATSRSDYVAVLTEIQGELRGRGVKFPERSFY